MTLKFGVFLAIFILGELIVNRTIFRYIKNYFNDSISDELQVDQKKFLGFSISVFKGIIERFLIYYALILNISQILIVFGAIKIGTRFDKNNKIKNDYFIVGNFFTILISILYYYFYEKIMAYN